MTEIVRAHQFSKLGNPDVLEWQEIDLAAPASGEIRIRHEAIGVNFIDIMQRQGTHTVKLELPSCLGMEGVGIVTALGDGVDDVAVGDRVAYVGGPPHGYATARNLPAARALALPDDMNSQDIAALIFKGLTVEYLIHRCAPVSRGDVVLLHAAAGGVGLIACQWLHHLGVTVIGTVSSAEKAALARQHGCDHVINYLEEDFQARVSDITGGKGVDVVYDSVGADTFAKSMDCLRSRGMLVSFGWASGPVDPVSLVDLGGKGGLFVTRPSIAHYTADRGEYEAAAEKLFDAIRTGVIKAPEIATYALEDAASAHRDIEARKTTGSVVLLP